MDGGQIPRVLKKIKLAEVTTVCGSSYSVLASSILGGIDLTGKKTLTTQG